MCPYTEYHDYVPLTLGTKTLYYLHDSGILDTEERLPTSWNYARKDIELKRKLEGQPEKPLGFAKNQKAVKIGPSQTKTFHCLAKAQTYGMTVNVIVEPMGGISTPSWPLSANIPTLKFKLVVAKLLYLSETIPKRF